MLTSLCLSIPRRRVDLLFQSGIVVSSVSIASGTRRGRRAVSGGDGDHDTRLADLDPPEPVVDGDGAEAVAGGQLVAEPASIGSAISSYASYSR